MNFGYTSSPRRSEQMRGRALGSLHPRQPLHLLQPLSTTKSNYSEISASFRLLSLLTAPFGRVIWTSPWQPQVTVLAQRRLQPASRPAAAPQPSHTDSPAKPPSPAPRPSPSIMASTKSMPLAMPRGLLSTTKKRYRCPAVLV